MATTTLSQSDLQALRSAGFGTIDPNAQKKRPPRLSIGSRGKTKSGKTHFALFTTPQPVAYIMLDPGSVLLAEKAVARGRIIVPKHIPHSTKEDQATAKNTWQEFRKAIRAVMNLKSIRTIVIDTVSECWDLLQMAEFGKVKQNNKFAYGGLNAEFTGIFDELYYARPDLNAVYIQKLKKEYGAEDKWDGKSYYAAGFSSFDYLVDLSITHHFSQRTFSIETLTTEATRLGGDFSGLRFPGEECSFMDLAMHIFGPGTDDSPGLNHPLGSDPAYWGMM